MWTTSGATYFASPRVITVAVARAATVTPSMPKILEKCDVAGRSMTTEIVSSVTVRVPTVVDLVPPPLRLA